MAEKLKVSREVADALNHMPVGLSTSEILKLHANNPYGWYNESKPLMDLKLEELATALIVGYEVEMTPHERIAYEYNYHQERAKEEKSGREKWVGKGYVRGVQRTLKNLNITVKGVNDNDNNS